MNPAVTAPLARRTRVAPADMRGGQGKQRWPAGIQPNAGTMIGTP